MRLVDWINVVGLSVTLATSTTLMGLSLFVWGLIPDNSLAVLALIAAIVAGVSGWALWRYEICD